MSAAVPRVRTRIAARARPRRLAGRHRSLAGRRHGARRPAARPRGRSAGAMEPYVAGGLHHLRHGRPLRLGGGDRRALRRPAAGGPSCSPSGSPSPAPSRARRARPRSTRALGRLRRERHRPAPVPRLALRGPGVARRALLPRGAASGGPGRLTSAQRTSTPPTCGSRWRAGSVWSSNQVGFSLLDRRAAGRHVGVLPGPRGAAARLRNPRRRVPDRALAGPARARLEADRPPGRR